MAMRWESRRYGAPGRIKAFGARCVNKFAGKWPCESPSAPIARALASISVSVVSVSGLLAAMKARVDSAFWKIMHNEVPGSEGAASVRMERDITAPVVMRGESFAAVMSGGRLPIQRART